MNWLQFPGRVATWVSAYTLEGFSFDETRDFYAAVYDMAPQAVNKLIGANPAQPATQVQSQYALCAKMHCTRIKVRSEQQNLLPRHCVMFKGHLDTWRMLHSTLLEM
jgi:hypothetical protein